MKRLALFLLLYFSLVEASECEKQLCDYPMPSEALAAQKDRKNFIGRGHYGEVYKIPLPYQGEFYVAKFFKNDKDFENEVAELRNLMSILNEKTRKYFPSFYVVNRGADKAIIKTFITGETLRTYLMGEDPKFFLDFRLFLKLENVFEDLSNVRNFIIHDLHSNNLIYNKKRGWTVIDFKLSPASTLKQNFWTLLWMENHTLDDPTYVGYLFRQSQKYKERP